MLADFLEEALLEQGHEVCGIASNVRDAVALARLKRPDVAVLDLQLSGNETGTDIVDRLMASGDLGRIGILYVTGETGFVHRDTCFGHACLHKPYSLAALEAAIRIVRDLACGRAVSQVPSHGIDLLAPPAASAPRRTGTSEHGGPALQPYSSVGFRHGASI